MDADLLAKLAQGGFAAGLLFLLYLVGMRIVRALDKVSEKLDSHTKTDMDHHAMVREELVAVTTRIDTLYDLTPVEQPKRQTRPRGVPIGQYSMQRPKTHGDDR